jgi:OmpA-OmpF porin, OOP family
VARKLLILLSPLLMTGCITHLHRLESLDPAPRDFNATLAAEYLAFAQSENEMKHWWAADRFAKKGLNALEGSAVPPEKIDRWNVDASAREGLDEGRNLLVAVIDDDARHIVPQKAARAQALFDCWVVQAARKPRPENGYVCENEMHSVLDDIRITTEMMMQKALPEGADARP